MGVGAGAGKGAGAFCLDVEGIVMGVRGWRGMGMEVEMVGYGDGVDDWCGGF